MVLAHSKGVEVEWGGGCQGFLSVILGVLEVFSPHTKSLAPPPQPGYKRPLPYLDVNYQCFKYIFLMMSILPIYGHQTAICFLVILTKLDTTVGAATWLIDLYRLGHQSTLQ